MVHVGRDDPAARHATLAMHDQIVARNLDGYTLVVQKSTAPVGTARDLGRLIKKHARRGAEFDVWASKNMAASIRSTAGVSMPIEHPDVTAITGSAFALLLAAPPCSGEELCRLTAIVCAASPVG